MPHSTPRDIWIFLGLPGTGKSVLVHKFVRKFGLTRLHMADFLGHLVHQTPAIESTRKRGELVEGFDIPFLESILNLDANQGVVLDGFPRTESQLRLLQEFASLHRWSLHPVILEFPTGREEELSLVRQSARLRARYPDGGPTYEAEKLRMSLKIDRALRVEQPLNERLKREMTEAFALDALLGTSKLMRLLSERYAPLLPPPVSPSIAPAEVPAGNVKGNVTRGESDTPSRSTLPPPSRPRRIRL